MKRVRPGASRLVSCQSFAPLGPKAPLRLCEVMVAWVCQFDRGLIFPRENVAVEGECVCKGVLKKMRSWPR